MTVAQHRYVEVPPPGFLRRIERAMQQQRMSLRHVCREAQISPAYLSRMLSEERPVPSDEVITRLERALKLPPAQLLYEAGRTDHSAKAVLKREGAAHLMRALAALNRDELKQIQQVADKLARKRHS